MHSHEVKTFFLTLIVGSVSVAIIHTILVYFHLLEVSASDVSGLRQLTDSFFMGLIYGVIVSLIIMSIVSLAKKRRIEPHILKYMFITGLVTSLGSLILEVMSPVLLTLEPLDIIFMIIVRFLPGMLVGALIWLVVWLIQDTTTEGKFLHHELFDHKAKSPHWPRIVLLVLFVLVGYGLGYSSVYPTVLELRQQIALYDELITNSQKSTAPAPTREIPKVTEETKSYRNSLLGFEAVLPIGWYSIAPQHLDIGKLSRAGTSVTALTLTNYPPQDQERVAVTPGLQTIKVTVTKANPAFSVVEQMSGYTGDMKQVTNVQIAGMKGYKIVRKETVNSTNTRQTVEYMVMRNSLLYDFTADEVSKTAVSFTDFEQLVQSITFGN